MTAATDGAWTNQGQLGKIIESHGQQLGQITATYNPKALCHFADDLHQVPDALRSYAEGLSELAIKASTQFKMNKATGQDLAAAVASINAAAKQTETAVNNFERADAEKLQRQRYGDGEDRRWDRLSYADTAAADQAWTTPGSLGELMNNQSSELKAFTLGYNPQALTHFVDDLHQVPAGIKSISAALRNLSEKASGQFSMNSGTGQDLGGAAASIEAAAQQVEHAASAAERGDRKLLETQRHGDAEDERTDVTRNQ